MNISDILSEESILVDFNASSKKHILDALSKLAEKEIGETIRISAIKLPEGVVPTIKDRDFTIATVAAPTVVKEPEPTAETEAASTSEGGDEAKTDDAKADGTDKASNDKEKKESADKK